MIENLIAEATECDFKSALETKKPKSWLKSVSAFANGFGGLLLFGIDNDKNIVGIENPQDDAEKISRLIKERISPFPDFVLTPECENGKNILILNVLPGSSTPYYYNADGITEAFIRMGNESIVAPPYILNNLILKGLNRTYDALPSEHDFNDYAFSKLRERNKVWTGNSLPDKFYDSFGLRNKDGKLTNAGALIADDSPVRHSRLFCTRWNGLDKSGGAVDALDGAEYSGSLIILLNEGMGFVRRNMKTMWKKTNDSRVEMPEYCERSVLEALVNALIHRDYTITGSEVHIDMYDDRLTIYSPGGMADGSRVQDRDITEISSVRRNPVLADIFGQLGYMERQGSGFRKITEAYQTALNFRPELRPKFYSDSMSFQITLCNLNYLVLHENLDIPFENLAIDSENPLIGEEKVAINPEKVAIDPEKVAIDSEKVAIAPEKVAIDSEKVAIERISLNIVTAKKIRQIFAFMRFDGIFGRSDIADITGDSVTAAGNLINKLKEIGLIEPVSGHGKGKYKFIRQP